ncbi:unnamed protein product [Echinostoma caproni]|uniref:Tubulin alpha chain n=1 Tax=Echinostoma caproni TaxID=27848 RepID=A0A183B0B4_9TREM|nr:unnamed protein product [Echinostoma caproni]
MVGQLLQLFVGQCGVQVSHACWELFCAESGLDSSGKPLWARDQDDLFGVDSLFTESRSGQRVPRCVLVDAEPSVVDEIRVGMHRKLFDPAQLISGVEDSAANFARGFYHNAKMLLEPTLERLRHLAEGCEKLQGFVLHHSMGGGTGSGFSCALLEEIQDQYSKCSRIQLAISPSSTLSNSTVEPYNALLSMHAPMELVDCTVLMDNLSLVRLCTERLLTSKISTTSLNRLIAQITSGLFSTLRFESELSASMSALLTNLVPYPAAHFVTGALTPLRGADVGAYNSEC